MSYKDLSPEDLALVAAMAAENRRRQLEGEHSRVAPPKGRARPCVIIRHRPAAKQIIRPSHTEKAGPLYQKSGEADITPPNHTEKGDR